MPFGLQRQDDRYPLRARVDRAFLRLGRNESRDVGVDVSLPDPLLERQVWIEGYRRPERERVDEPVPRRQSRQFVQAPARLLFHNHRHGIGQQHVAERRGGIIRIGLVLDQDQLAGLFAGERPHIRIILLAGAGHGQFTPRQRLPRGAAGGEVHSKLSSAKRPPRHQMSSIDLTSGTSPRPMARVFSASRWIPSNGPGWATVAASKNGMPASLATRA